MKPKKYKEITSKLVEENNWNEELVSDAISFFYSRVRRALSSLEDTSILIPKLGTFKARRAKVRKLIQDKENLLTKLNPHEFTKYDSFRKNSTDLVKLKALEEKFEKLNTNKNEFNKENSKDS